MHNLRVLTTIAVEIDGVDKFYHIDYINQKIYFVGTAFPTQANEEIREAKLKDFIFRKLESQPIDIPELAAVDKMIDEVQQIRQNYQGYKEENSEEEEINEGS